MRSDVSGLVLGIAVLAGACGDRRPAASDGTATGSRGPTPQTPTGVTVTTPEDAGTSNSPGSSGGPVDASADAGTPYAAPIDAGIYKPPYVDDVCKVAPIGWWATAVTVDDTVSTPAFASTLNALLAKPNAHPFTLAAWTDESGWRFVASASLTNGIGQQYFPFDHLGVSMPGAVPGLTIGTPAGAAGDAAWLRLVDGAGHDVWIPIAHVEARASVNDEYCTQAVGGVMTATITSAADATPVTPVSGPATTLGALLGPDAGSGWPLRMIFDANKVQITLK